MPLETASRRAEPPWSLHVDAPGSSHVSSQNAELRILSVHRQGRGQLVAEGHDTLFTESELEALNSLSAHNSVAKSLDCGERLNCRKELAFQETQDNILIKEEADIGGCIPPVEDCNDIRDCSAQQGATSDRLHPDAPGSSHMSSHKFGPLRSRKKSYRCDECMKVYSSGFSLKIHMRIHSVEKPHRCDQCMKGFKRSYDLKIHKRIHSGEKPCVCHQCNISFRYSSGLRRHMSKQHKGKGVL